MRVLCMMGMALSNYGTMSRAERNRTRLRVANAIRAHAQAGRWLGGRPPYGYLIADHGPHSNPSKAASGARLHQLAPDPVTAPVVQRNYDSYPAGACGLGGTGGLGVGLGCHQDSLMDVRVFRSLSHYF